MACVLADVRPAAQPDVAVLYAMRSGCERWLAERGIEQWGVGEVSVDEIAAQVCRGEWFVGVAASHVVVGALRYLATDEDVWPDIPSGAARFVHGLMVDRRTAVAGTGAALLAWAEARATTDGIGVMRLDCVESNHRLRDFYRGLGYVEVGRRDFDGQWFSATLFEKCLAPPSD